MKTWSIVLVLGLVSFQTLAQRTSQGIGLRLGSPAGITYKRFLNNNNAIEAVLGTAPSSWYGDYYRNSFDDYDEYDDFRYSSHNVESTLFLSGRYLIHRNIPTSGIDGTLSWYYGAGGVFKLARVRYRYINFSGNNFAAADNKVDVDLGPEVIGGLEYYFSDLPLSVFGEASLFLELVDRPASLQIYGGLGLRYLF